ncbi:hypothetical protein LJR039_005524 [Pseudorhodoferax sp. LjRoot39]|uniref:hypothetical protein n=1 Tax=Pseudorhodoferax sp. LjRoot39 TaxID=3342328 RepID=UPI003ECD24CB
MRPHENSLGRRSSKPTGARRGALTLQHMATVQSRNAKNGTYSQVRVSKSF